jgi:DNA-binding transcriptional LysR family regulator
MNLTLRQIRAFVAVARFESFTKAAELLHLTQPALTVQVRQFEEALGLRVFDRSTRHVWLTAAGKDLAPVLQSLLHELDVVVESSKHLSAKRVGVVRIGCLPSIATTLLPAAIAQFQAAYPNISFVIKDEVAKRIIAKVRQEEVDFGITDVDVNAPDLFSTVLVEEPMHAFFPAGHPVATVAKLTLEELAKYPLVLTIPESNARAMIDTAFSSIGRLAVASCEVTNMATAFAMVRAGLGITILPARACDLSMMPDLRARSVEAPGFIRRIAITRKSDRSLSPAAQVFVDLLLKERLS